MSRRARWLIGTLLVLLLATATSVGAATVVAYRAGSVAVAVAPSDGPAVSLRVPAVLVDLAVALVPARLLRDELHGVHELRPFTPLLRAAARELERCPDATLVEVRDRGDTVVVEKTGDTLIVRVDTGDERVRIAVPVRTLDRVARKLQSAVAAGV